MMMVVLVLTWAICIHKITPVDFRYRYHSIYLVINSVKEALKELL